MFAWCPGRTEKDSGPLETQFQMSHYVNAEILTSGRAAHALTCWAASPASFSVVYVCVQVWCTSLCACIWCVCELSFVHVCTCIVYDVGVSTWHLCMVCVQGVWYVWCVLMVCLHTPQCECGGQDNLECWSLFSTLFEIEPLLFTGVQIMLATFWRTFCLPWDSGVDRVLRAEFSFSPCTACPGSTVPSHWPPLFNFAS